MAKYIERYNSKWRKKNRIANLVLILILIIATIGNVADAKDLGKRDIKKLSNQLRYFFLEEVMYKTNQDEVKKYNFSKQSVRRSALGVCYWSTYHAFGYDSHVDFSTEYSKWLFGKSTSKTYYYEGEWGDMDAYIKLKKIKKRLGGKYYVTADLYYEAYRTSRKKMGTLSMVIKRNSHSRYNCVMRSAILKRTARDDIFD